MPEAIKSTTYEPYPMYYYGLAGEGTNPIKGYTDKDFTQGEATITAGDPIGSSYAAIKVSGVNYGVGPVSYTHLVWERKSFPVLSTTTA